MTDSSLGLVALAVALDANNRAQNASRTADRAECQSLINEYEGRKLAVEEWQEYATCVQLLYPAPQAAADSNAMLVIVAIGLASLVAVGWWRGKEEGLFGGVLAGLFAGCLVVFLGVALMALLQVSGLLAK